MQDNNLTNGPVWTEERIALLVKLREENVGRRKIAELINEQTGSSFTKASICGKIDRLFTAAKPTKTPEERAATLLAQRERDREKKRRARQASAAKLRPRRPNTFKVVEFRPEDFTEHNVSEVRNLEAHHCRWPVNDDMAAPIFCGLHVIKDTSWCSGHAGIVYRPLDRRVAA